MSMLTLSFDEELIVIDALYDLAAELEELCCFQDIRDINKVLVKIDIDCAYQFEDWPSFLQFCNTGRHPG